MNSNAVELGTWTQHCVYRRRPPRDRGPLPVGSRVTRIGAGLDEEAAAVWEAALCWVTAS